MKVELFQMDKNPKLQKSKEKALISFEISAF